MFWLEHPCWEGGYTKTATAASPAASCSEMRAFGVPGSDSGCSGCNDSGCRLEVKRPRGRRGYLLYAVHRRVFHPKQNGPVGGCTSPARPQGNTPAIVGTSASGGAR